MPFWHGSVLRIRSGPGCYPEKGWARCLPDRCLFARKMRVPFTQSTRSKEQADEETIEAVMVVTDAKGRKHNYKLHLTQANK